MSNVSEVKLAAKKSEPKFEYVVERQEKQKVCFGSTKERKTGPIDVRKIGPVGPGSYNIKSGLYEFLNKIRSKKGTPGLANGGPRLGKRIVDQTPSPTRYNPDERKPIKEGAAPFGIRSRRGKAFIDKNPGPGNYFCQIRKCRRTRLDDNFGKPTMIPAVEETCIPVAIDTCSKCSKICENDYWQSNHTTFLCERCMVEENKLHEMYTKEQLRGFEKVRNCFYIHSHEGTTAAVRIMSKFHFQIKHRIENYLDLYITC